MSWTFARLTLAIVVLIGICTACTAGPDALAEQLPAAEAIADEHFAYQVEAEDRSSPTPPLLDGRLLAAHAAHPRYAVSDGRRLWVGEGQAPPSVGRQPGDLRPD